MSRSRISLSIVVGLALIGVVGTVALGWRPGLGLDLQGGASVVYAPKGAYTQEGLRQAETIIRNRVDGLGVAEPVVRREGERIVVELPGVTDRERALGLVGRTAELRFRPVLQNLPTKLDLEVSKAEQANTTTTRAPQGTATTKAGAATTKAGTATTKAATATTKAAATATTKAATTTVAPALGGRGASAVLSATPSTTAPTTKAGSAAPTTKAGSAAPTAVASTTPAPTTPAPTTPAPTTPAPEFGPDGLAKLTPLDQERADAYVTLAETDPDGTETARYFLGPTELTGRIVKEALADNSQGTWQISLEFTGEGSRQWDALAKQIVGRQLAIVLDGDVLSAPTIQEAQFNGRAVITSGLGGFPEQEAKDIALALRYGSLPVQLTEETVQTVSPSLGSDSLRAGIFTGLLGIALVAAYMIFFYRALGIVVIAGLCVSAALMWTLIAFVSETRGLALSLSGAVGLIVSVGVTVDSYVVFFEKLKDEIRSGRPVGSSVERGFRRAWRTILAADFVSLLGALILYLATTGGVRGFAFFLMMSTALDIFVAWMFTRPAVTLLGARHFFTHGRWGVANNMAFAASATAAAGGGGAAPATARIRPGTAGGRITPGAAAGSDDSKDRT